MTKYFSVLSLIILLSSCGDNCFMSNSEKNQLAYRYLEANKNNIISDNFRGGENINWRLLSPVDYDCSNSQLKFSVLFNFSGQYTSSRYWVKGILTFNTSNNNYRFHVTEQDPMLNVAVPLQKKFEESLEETISNYLKDNIENSNNSSNGDGDNNSYTPNIEDSTRP
jgi:hypothetical protein